MNANNELNLNFKPIYVLPNPLPAGIRILRCDQTNITKLPPLPEGLEVLCCSYNKGLTHLGLLPSTLKTLECYGSPIERIHEIPDRLENLDCSLTHIKYLPELPCSLRSLRVSGTALRVLPELGRNLRYLNISQTRITVLPNLPTWLSVLDISETGIKHIGPNLPPYLRRLIYDKTNIRELPMLPDSLEMLSLLYTKTCRLPNIPSRLQSLYCSMTFLESAFDTLPSSLSDVGCMCEYQRNGKKIYDGSCFECYAKSGGFEEYDTAFISWKARLLQDRIDKRFALLQRGLYYK